MNTSRRSFLKTLATAAAAFTILPSAVASQRAGWKPVPFVKRASGIYVVNPAWRDATHEIWFLVHPENLKHANSVIVERNARRIQGEYAKLSEPFPIRMNGLDGAPIAPMIRYLDEM